MSWLEDAFQSIVARTARKNLKTRILPPSGTVGESLRVQTHLGTISVLADSKAPGFELDTGGNRWALICETHGCCTGVRLKRDAMILLTDPEEYCQECCKAQEDK
jgi:hypothetical protein